MKRLFLLIILIALFLLPIKADAGTWETCYWIWSTDVTTANDAPDSVYCSRPGSAFKSRGTAYKQSTRGADNVSISIDTTWDNSKKVPDVPASITPCSNTATTGDLNVLECIYGACDTGTTTIAYYQKNDIADAIVTSVPGGLTPPTEAFKLSVDGDTATCWVVRTTVYWESN